MFVCLCVNWVINYSILTRTHSSTHLAATMIYIVQQIIWTFTRRHRDLWGVSTELNVELNPILLPVGLCELGMTELVSIYHLHVIIVLILSAITGGQKSCFVWQSFSLSLSAVNWTKTTSAASRTAPSELWEVWKCCKCLNCCSPSNPKLNSVKHLVNLRYFGLFFF